jgi:hypothetical protein
MIYETLTDDRREDGTKLKAVLAAFSPADIDQQLSDAGLAEWTVTVVSERHVAIRGTAPRHPPA